VKSTKAPSSNQVLSVSAHRPYSLLHLIFFALSDSRLSACFGGEMAGTMGRFGAVVLQMQFPCLVT
jgi:hypothetical protein